MVEKGKEKGKEKDRDKGKDDWAVVGLKNNFYKDNFSRVMTMLMMSIVLNFAFGTGLVYMYLNKPQPAYFAAKDDGSLLAMIPLADPYVSQDLLLTWASQAALAAFSFNFLDYQNNLAPARKYFTAEGFDNYLKALNESGNLKTVAEKKLVVKAAVTNTPVILQEGQMGGRYAWKVQVPMVVRYVSASAEIRQPIVVTMLIARVSTLQSQQGIAIAQFIVQDRKE